MECGSSATTCFSENSTLTIQDTTKGFATQRAVKLENLLYRGSNPRIVPIQVTIPGPLLQYTRNQKEVQVNARSVLNAIVELDRMFPGMKDRICDEREKVRDYVNIFVNGKDFRHLKGEQTSLGDGDEIMILPSIAGGAL